MEKTKIGGNKFSSGRRLRETGIFSRNFLFVAVPTAPAVAAAAAAAQKWKKFPFAQRWKIEKNSYVGLL